MLLAKLMGKHNYYVRSGLRYIQPPVCLLTESHPNMDYSSLLDGYTINMLYYYNKTDETFTFELKGILETLARKKKIADGPLLVLNVLIQSIVQVTYC